MDADHDQGPGWRYLALSSSSSRPMLPRPTAVGDVVDSLSSGLLPAANTKTASDARRRSVGPPVLALTLTMVAASVLSDSSARARHRVCRHRRRSSEARRRG